jgi:hypothetical protein
LDVHDELLRSTARPHRHLELHLGWQSELDQDSTLNCLLEFVLLWNVQDWRFYPTTSSLALLGLEFVRDCLAHLGVPEVYTILTWSFLTHCLLVFTLVCTKTDIDKLESRKWLKIAYVNIFR